MKWEVVNNVKRVFVMSVSLTTIWLQMVIAMLVIIHLTTVYNAINQIFVKDVTLILLILNQMKRVNVIAIMIKIGMKVKNLQMNANVEDLLRQPL